MKSLRISLAWVLVLSLGWGTSAAMAEETAPVPDASTAAPDVEPTADPSPSSDPSPSPSPSATDSAPPADPSPAPTASPSSAPATQSAPAPAAAPAAVSPDSADAPLESGQDTVTAASDTSSAFTGSVAASRVFVGQDGTKAYEWPDGSRDNATDQPRTIELHVSATSNLRSRQQIDVSWSGAHPTGGTVANPNSPAARDQEYPFVLLQCRGVDGTDPVPAGQVRLSPQTCWTQTRAERYLEDTVNQWPPWRSDAWAEPAERQRLSGAPYNGGPATSPCPSTDDIPAAHWLPFAALTGVVYTGGPSDPGCAKVAPETDDGESGLPTNSVYGITRTDGTGSSKFTVWTKTENASLGCSADVKCSLVAVPIVGLSCDAWGLGVGPGTGLAPTQRPTTSQGKTADGRCRAADKYKAGASHGFAPANPASSGELWWAASNWRNRISVPLDFAVSGDVCALATKDKPLTMFGSVGMSELTASWQPKFCTTDSLFNFTHVVSADPAARNLLDTGGVDAAFGTAPKNEAYTRPVARAPLALSGFAIAFKADNAKHEAVGDLRLNARLLAKLLSESYAANSDVLDNYPTLAKNPRNLFNDPEFRAFNPGMPDTAVFEAAAALQTLLTDSDLAWAVTRYIDADPEARGWLNGVPDPWGMQVNPAYQDIDLPVTSWPLLDDWPVHDAAAIRTLSQGNICYKAAAQSGSPTPYLQLIANPIGLMSTIVQNVQYGISAVKLACNAAEVTDRDQIAFRQQGRQSVGSRFVLGIVPLSAAYRYSLPVASLQTSSTVGKRDKFTDTAGRTFVAPTDESLKAAASLLKPGSGAEGWSLDYAALSTPSGAAAYPGAMPMYVDMPSSDLDPNTAAHFADFLCYAAGPGQVQGTANGQLPAGYLPLTEANGLGALHSQTYAAAAAVRAQHGDVPEVGTTSVSESDACSPSKAATKPKSKKKDAPAPAATPAAAAAAAAPAAPPAEAPKAPKGGDVVAMDTVRTTGQTTAIGAYGPLLLLMLFLVAGISGIGLRWGAYLPELAHLTVAWVAHNRPTRASVVARIRQIDVVAILRRIRT